MFPIAIVVKQSQGLYSGAMPNVALFRCCCRAFMTDLRSFGDTYLTGLFANTGSLLSRNEARSYVSKNRKRKRSCIKGSTLHLER